MLASAALLSQCRARVAAGNRPRTAASADRERMTPTSGKKARDASEQPAPFQPGTVVRQGAMYWVGRTVPAAISLTALALYTRLLSPADYGVVALVFSLAHFAFDTGLLWLCVAVLRLHSITEDPPDLRANIVILYLAIVVTSMVGIAVAAASPLLYEHRIILLLGFTLWVVIGWVELNLHMFMAEMDTPRYVRLSVARAVGSAMGGLGFAYAGLGASGTLFGIVLGTVLPGLGQVRQLIRGGLHRRIKRAVLWQIAGYGGPLTPGLALGATITRVDRWLIAWFLGTDALGIYAVAFDLADRTIRAVLQPVGVAAFPLAMRGLQRGGVAGARAQLRINLLLLLGIGLPATAGLALVARGLAAVILAPEFGADAPRIVQLVAAGTFLAIMRASYLDHPFHLQQRSLLLSVVIAVTAAASLGLNLLLIPWLEAFGAACAYLIAHGVGIALGAILAPRVFPLPLPLGDIARIALGTSIMVLGFQLFPPLAGPGGLALQVLVGGTIYVLSSVALNVGGLRSGVSAWRGSARRAR